MGASTLWIYAIVYIIAGVIIYKCLRKLDMRVASACFCALFTVGLIDIPIVYGSEAFIRLISPCFDGIYERDSFLRCTRSPFLAFLPYFSVTSVVTFLIALVSGIATIILTVTAVGYVVRCMRSSRQRRMPRPSQKFVSVRALPVQNPKRFWIEYCRLLHFVKCKITITVTSGTIRSIQITDTDKITDTNSTI